MIRKLILRMLLVGGICVGLLVTAVCVAAYLAFQQPAFYAQLLTEQPTAAEQQAVKAQWKQTGKDMEEWLQNSLARQQVQSSDAQTTTTQLLSMFGGAYSPSDDVYTLRFTERQMNTLLASDELHLGRDWQNARVCMLADRVEFAAQLATPSGDCVLSIALEPTLNSSHALRLDIASVRVGRLPLPLNTILRCLPHEVAYTGRGAELDLTPPSPHLTLNFVDQGQRAPTVKSIACLPGEIVVEFLPPVLNQEQPRNPADTESLSSMD